MRILIAGGGIAGLTAALSLHAAGFRQVTVVESAPDLKPVGAGLNLMPNAVRELDALGLLQDLDRVGLRTRELRYYHRSGGLISREPRGTRAGYRWPQLSLHRGALQLTLARAVRARLGESALLTGARLTHFTEHSGYLTAHLTGASAARPTKLDTDVLVGADGIRSTVRARLNPAEGDPPWNGMLVWRGVTRRPANKAVTFMSIAGDDRLKAVVYPMTDPRSHDDEVLLNWAVAMPAAEDRARVRGDWNRPVPVTGLLHHFEGWCFDGLDVAEVLAGTDGAYEYPMVDRDPLPQWTHGRATLLGDAAHAMYPIGSNGATQSIIDGRALAWALAHHRDPRKALAAYEAERRPATTRLQQANRRLGPEVVINLAHERAPHGFTDIEKVIPRAELTAVSRRYAHLGAFDVASANEGSPYEVTPVPRERRGAAEDAGRLPGRGEAAGDALSLA